MLLCSALVLVMGACSSAPLDKDGVAVNQQINKTLVNDAAASKSLVKILLLGAGECGKSTILKQMKILHRNGFDEQERHDAIDLVRKNTLQSIQALIQACRDLEINFGSDDARHSANLVADIKENEIIPCTDLILQMKCLWKDEGILTAYQRQNEFTLLDSAKYFLDDVERTFDSKYNPIDQDILRTRLPTTGILETDFLIDKINFKMCDVGGQRGERKKWIHCFEDARAILFIASLSEYDQVLAEDRTRNRLVESLSLFEGILSLPWFKNTAIILFLNKNDIFSEKITRIDLGIYFNSYVGGLDYEEGLYFIKELFFSKNDNPSKTIYAHVTNATDTNHMAFVWKCTKHIVMQQNLSRAGLIMV